MGRFKLDENLSAGLRDPLVQAGHEVSTVADEGLNGQKDPVVAEACQRGRFSFITADQDFAQILDYPPERYPGLIVLRHPRPTLRRVLELIRQIADAAGREPLTGRLWIVEPGRIRIHGSRGEDDLDE